MTRPSASKLCRPTKCWPASEVEARRHLADHGLGPRSERRPADCQGHFGAQSALLRPIAWLSPGMVQGGRGPGLDRGRGRAPRSCCWFTAWAPTAAPFSSGALLAVAPAPCSERGFLRQIPKRRSGARRRSDGPKFPLRVGQRVNCSVAASVIAMPPSRRSPGCLSVGEVQRCALPTSLPRLTRRFRHRALITSPLHTGRGCSATMARLMLLAIWQTGSETRACSTCEEHRITRRPRARSSAGTRA
jgi:hypothetical protein